MLGLFLALDRDKLGRSIDATGSCSAFALRGIVRVETQPIGSILLGMRVVLKGIAVSSRNRDPPAAYRCERT